MCPSLRQKQLRQSGAGSGLVECIASMLALQHDVLFPCRSETPEGTAHLDRQLRAILLVELLSLAVTPQVRPVLSSLGGAQKGLPGLVLTV